LNTPVEISNSSEIAAITVISATEKSGEKGDVISKKRRSIKPAFC
jgi:hypothetical protein